MPSAFSTSQTCRNIRIEHLVGIMPKFHRKKSHGVVILTLRATTLRVVVGTASRKPWFEDPVHICLERFPVLTPYAIHTSRRYPSAAHRSITNLEIYSGRKYHLFQVPQVPSIGNPPSWRYNTIRGGRNLGNPVLRTAALVSRQSRPAVIRDQNGYLLCSAHSA